MDCKILALRVDNRCEYAVDVQKLLTDYGSYIKTRVGFHEANKDFSGDDGIIILHMCAEGGGSEAAQTLKSELDRIDGVSTTMVTFDH